MKKEPILGSRDLGTKCQILDPKSPIKQNFRFPFFVECSHFTLDSYWIRIFEDCARGKFPNKCMYDPISNSITIKHKKGTLWYKITDDPKITLVELKKHFQELLNMKSLQDGEQNREQMNQVELQMKENYDDFKTELKKKSNRQSLLREYSLIAKKERNLTNSQTVELYTLLNLGFLLNWITNDSIVYSKNEKISKIKELHFTEKGFYIDTTTDKKTKRVYSDAKQKLSKLWKKRA